jgi:uncharacterized YccA/Bax inhibitor family protein
MKVFNKLNLSIVLGAAVFGAALMAIESSIGFLKWHAEYRAQLSPTYFAVIGFLGGAVYSLRATLDRVKSTPAIVAIAIASGATFGTLAWAGQSYGLPQYVGNLQPLGAAIFGALLLGTCALLGVLMARKR